MKDQDAPPLTGPSEFSQSITIAVSPDVLPQDGASQSFITVTARDANAQPIRNLTLRTETRVGGTPGRLRRPVGAQRRDRQRRQGHARLYGAAVASGLARRLSHGRYRRHAVRYRFRQLHRSAARPFGWCRRDRSVRPSTWCRPSPSRPLARRQSDGALRRLAQPGIDRGVSAGTSATAAAVDGRTDDHAYAHGWHLHRHADGRRLPTAGARPSRSRSPSTAGTQPTAVFIFSPTRDPSAGQVVNFNAAQSRAAGGWHARQLHVELRRRHDAVTDR